MKQGRWVEIIGVRLFSRENRSKVEDIFNQLNSMPPSGSGKSISTELYMNNQVESDWSIYLYRSPAADQPAKTRLGLGIAEAFSSLGLVNHSVWTANSTGKEF